MKYVIETQLSGFLQFITLPEGGDTWVYPSVEQHRGGVTLLQRLQELLTKVRERKQWVEDNYHDDNLVRYSFEFGEVMSSPGDPHLLVLLQRDTVTVLVGSTVVFKDVRDPGSLRQAVQQAIEQLSAN